MKVTRRTVDELNELAEKITGVNPGAKTDAQALNYIEQNYLKSSPLLVYDLHENEGGFNEIDLTYKQLKEINRKTNGHFVIVVNEGYGVYRFINQLELEDPDAGMLLDEASSFQLGTTSEDEKFNDK